MCVLWRLFLLAQQEPLNLTAGSCLTVVTVRNEWLKKDSVAGPPCVVDAWTVDVKSCTGAIHLAKGRTWPVKHAPRHWANRMNAADAVRYFGVLAHITIVSRWDLVATELILGLDFIFYWLIFIHAIEQVRIRWSLRTLGIINNKIDLAARETVGAKCWCPLGVTQWCTDDG